MQTLYRKYRPQLWKEVFGQDVIKNVLENQILNGKISHAYIFAGSRGVGKTTVARLFAKTLNCQNRAKNEIEPCNKCESCIAINSSSDLNIIEIDAASYTGVDNVRELRNIAKIPPEKNKYKIFIIDEAQMLSKAAFNALLKILEEPPERVIFILATTEINKIPDTILSRCQIFKFKKPSKKEIIEALKYIVKNEKVNIDDKILDDIANEAHGAFRDAETLLGQILSSTDESDIKEEKVKELINESDIDIMLAFISNIISKNVKDNLDLIEKIKDLNISFEDFTLDLIEFFRKILVYKYNQDVMERWSNLENDLKEKIISLSKTIDFNYLDKIIRKLIDVRLDMAKSSIIELPLQLAIIELVEDENNKKIDNKVNIDDIDEILENSTTDKKNEKKEKEEIPDLEKRERLLQKFGIKKADSKQVKEGGETSVLDLIQEEFKNEIIN